MIEWTINISFLVGGIVSVLLYQKCHSYVKEKQEWEDRVNNKIFKMRMDILRLDNSCEFLKAKMEKTDE